MKMEPRILIIGAHNDECEYGLGGVTWLLTQRGCKVRYINTSGLWHKPGHTKEESDEWVRQENRAAELLGADKIVLGDRELNLCETGREVSLEIEKIMLDFKPDIVFLHWPKDNHLEHRISARCAYDALCIAWVHGAKVKEAYAFEAGPNQTSDYFAPEFAIDIADAMPAIKESLMQFDQPTAKGPGLWREKEMAAHYRGYCYGMQYAEVYKLLKLPNGNDDFLLKTLLADKFRWNGNGMYPAFGERFFGADS